MLSKDRLSFFLFILFLAGNAFGNDDNPWTLCAQSFQRDELMQNARGSQQGLMYRHQTLVFRSNIDPTSIFAGSIYDKVKKYVDYGTPEELMVELFRYYNREKGEGFKNFITIEQVSHRSPYSVAIPYEDYLRDRMSRYWFDWTETERVFYDLRRPDGATGFSSGLLTHHDDANLTDLGLFYSTETAKGPWGADAQWKKTETLTYASDQKGDVDLNRGAPWLMGREVWTRELQEDNTPVGEGLYSFLQENNNILHEPAAASEPADSFHFESFGRYLEETIGSKRRLEPWARMRTSRLGARLVFYDVEGVPHQIGFFNVDRYSIAEVGTNPNRRRVPYEGLDIDIEVVPSFIPADLDFTSENGPMNNFHTTLLDLIPGLKEVNPSHHRFKISQLRNRP